MPEARLFQKAGLLHQKSIGHLPDASAFVAANPDAKLLSGGMTLIPTLKQRLARQEHVHLGMHAQRKAIAPPRDLHRDVPRLERGDRTGIGVHGMLRESGIDPSSERKPLRKIPHVAEVIGVRMGEEHRVEERRAQRIERARDTRCSLGRARVDEDGVTVVCRDKR